MRGWAMLAGCLALLAAPMVAFPNQVTSLFPGAVKFTSRLASPPSDAKNLQIRFAQSNEFAAAD